MKTPSDFCPKCGAEFDQGAERCPKCGRMLRFVPKGAGQPLPPIPDEIKFSEADIEMATDNWDRLMPEYAGMLDATIDNKPDTRETVGKKRKRRSKVSPDVAQYFAEFSPTAEQLGQLAKLLRLHKSSYGSEAQDRCTEAALVLAPGELTRLTPAAVDLLRRCQNRIWSLKDRPGDQYGVNHKQTYAELFGLLLSLGLIEEATPRQKLTGAITVPQARALLRSRDLSSNGKKAELIGRLFDSLPAHELESWTEGVILYRTTSNGERAIEILSDLASRMQKVFHTAWLHG